MSLRGVYAGHVTDSVLLMAVPPFERDPLQLAYVQVAGHIAARIEAGELAPGARLPRSGSWLPSTGSRTTRCGRQ